MKTNPAIQRLFSFAILLAALPLTPASGEILPENDPLFVAPFVPPAPQEPMEMPALSVKDSVEARMENRRQMRIVRAEPSDLPDMPTIRRELARKDEAAELAPGEGPVIPEPDRKTIALGATVIGGEISHVTWTDDAGEKREALCGFDIGLLAGVPGFSHSGTTYSLMLMPGFHTVERDGGFQTPAFPGLSVKPGQILLPAAARGAEIPEDLKVIASLIAHERERLVEFQRAMERRQEAERKWREANPEPPRDEVMWIRPHAGSRYLDGAETNGTNGKRADK